ncbi:hypothetical protein EVAR_76575_1 [Eumeta japonica]|uniref:Uncharacterized protein n=1 Tax=Eumeta variegata TaxID=151549 RepID=A0A4C1T7Q5_EUMVA|nr:hypothetical protein EVAR_76575_1 [Eumeta japonica]
MSKPLEERKKFWADVRDILMKCNRNERIVIQGDFNGWVGVQLDEYEKVLDFMPALAKPSKMVTMELERIKVCKRVQFDRPPRTDATARAPALASYSLLCRSPPATLRPADRESCAAVRMLHN